MSSDPDIPPAKAQRAKRLTPGKRFSCSSIPPMKIFPSCSSSYFSRMNRAGLKPAPTKISYPSRPRGDGTHSFITRPKANVIRPYIRFFLCDFCVPFDVAQDMLCARYSETHRCAKRTLRKPSCPSCYYTAQFTRPAQIFCVADPKGDQPVAPTSLLWPLRSLRPIFFRSGFAALAQCCGTTLTWTGSGKPSPLAVRSASSTWFKSN